MKHYGSRYFRCIVVCVAFSVISHKVVYCETCPKTHGDLPISQSSTDTSTALTVANIGNPITCDGYIKGWRYFPQQSSELLALVLRRRTSGKKFYVISRLILPVQEDSLNKVQEYRLDEIDWIPVLSGDVIAFHGLLPYEDATGNPVNECWLSDSLLSSELILSNAISFDTENTFRAYSLQALLTDLESSTFNHHRVIIQNDAGTLDLTSMFMNDFAKFSTSGTIIGWRILVAGAGTVNAFVFRMLDNEAGTYEVIGKTIITLTSEQINMEVEYTLKYSEQIAYLAGDRTGLYSIGNVIYRYTQSYKSFRQSMYTSVSDISVDDVNVGSVLTFSGKTARRFGIDPIVQQRYDPLRTFRSEKIVKDFKLENSNVLTDKSRLECIMECMDTECKSINYNKESRNCELNDETWDSENANIVSEVGQTYIEMKRTMQSGFSQCNMVDCGPGKVCEPSDNSERYLCRCISTGFVTGYCPVYGECSDVLGMKSGIIVDAQITASSFASGDYPYCARVDEDSSNKCPSGTWRSNAFTNEWLKIDLIIEHNITGVVTQGRRNTDERVAVYSISYFKFDELGENFITDGNGKVKLFSGNYEDKIEFAQYFKTAIQGTAIKFHIKEWNVHISMRVEILGCKTDNRWVRAFKAVSRNGLSIYDAWVSGVGTSFNHADRFLASDKHYRNVFLDNWSAQGIQKVKLTLYSAFDEELQWITFNGVGTSRDSWFAHANVEDSSWDDLKTSSLNFFSIEGHALHKRRFFINHSYAGGCPNDYGWLLVDENDSDCFSYEGYDANPVILFSRTNTFQNWESGSIGAARAMTVDVLLG